MPVVRSQSPPHTSIQQADLGAFPAFNAGQYSLCLHDGATNQPIADPVPLPVLGTEAKTMGLTAFFLPDPAAPAPAIVPGTSGAS
jgi:hypothetical protein